MLHPKNYTLQKEQYLYGVVLVFIFGALFSAAIRFYTQEYIITFIDLSGLGICFLIMYNFEKNRDLHKTVIALFWLANCVVFSFIIYFEFSLHILLVLMIPLAASILVDSKTFIFHGSLFLFSFSLIMFYGFYYQERYPYLQDRDFLIAFSLLFFYVVSLSLVYNQSIEKSYQQKEFLLREVHHRVKNNLNIVASILGLEKLESDSAEVHNVVNKNRLRIESIAMIHEILYQNNNFEHINFNDYIQNLTQHILSSEQNTQDIKLKLHIIKLELKIEDMIQFGIIINELMTNTIKYAFDDKHGEISISLKQNMAYYCLRYSDNGVGLQDSNAGFGQNLVHMCIDQLDAKLHLSHEDGLTYEIIFKAKTK